MTHYGKSCLSDGNKVDYLHNVAQLYDKVNPDKTLLSALVDYIFNEYSIDKSEPKGKIINAEHQLGHLVKYYKNGVGATSAKDGAIKVASKVGLKVIAAAALKLSVKDIEGIATVKEAAILLAHQNSATKELGDQIAIINVEANDAPQVLGDTLLAFV